MHFASYYRWLVYQHLFGKPALATTLLDVGCDDGGFAGRIAARMSVAVDLALPSLRNAPTVYKVCADGARMPFHDVTFDLVLLSDVIEHVLDDQALVADVTSCIKPGGILWLSTTAVQFTLFPPQITARAEQSWGHVRKGYAPETLIELIGDDFDCELIEWPEVLFRHTYALIWLSAKWMPGLARALARCCFMVDSRLRNLQPRNGHIYIRAIRRR